MGIGNGPQEIEEKDVYHFFVSPEQIRADSVMIKGPDVNHIKNVLRMKPGEKVLISDGNGMDYECEISEITGEYVEADILSCDGAGTELPVRLYLFQGLPKSDKMELIIQKAVELGAYQVIPVNTKRCVVKLDEKKAKARTDRWNKIAESAAKQSKRSVIPQVTPVMSFADACRMAGELDRNLIPYEAAHNMEETRQELREITPGMKAGIFIGPEGGFEETEIEQAVKAGIRPVTLGRRILRTETAGLAILSILMFQLEE